MFNKQLLVITTLFFSFLLGGTLYADTQTATPQAAPSDSHKAAALKLLDVTNTAELLEQTTTQMTGMFSAMSQRPGLNEDQKKIIQDYQQKATELLKSELTWDKLKDEFVQLYTEVYTEPELKELTRFYETPVGKKMLQKTPELMARSMQISQQHVQRLVPQMQQLMMQMGKTLSAQAPAKK